VISVSKILLQMKMGKKGRLNEKQQHFIKSRNAIVSNDLQHYIYQNEY